MLCVRTVILQSQTIGDTDNTSAAGHTDHVAVKIQGNGFFTQIQGTCKLDVVDKLDGGKSLVKSVF